MADVASRPQLILQVIASGTHLSETHGATWQEIAGDGFMIDARVEMSVGADDAESVARLPHRRVSAGVAVALVRLQTGPVGAARRPLSRACWHRSGCRPDPRADCAHSRRTRLRVPSTTPSDMP